MKYLCVAEKPSVAKSVAEILSGGQFHNRPGKDQYCRNYDFQYRFDDVGFVNMTMTSVRGHLTNSDFEPEYRSWRSCDPSALFEAPIVTSISDDAKRISRNLGDEARNASMLIIWTDCDREGEHIGAEIVREVRKANRQIVVKRARFSAIISNQIHAACRNAEQLDWHAASAVEARMELDLRIGASFTRMQSLRLQARFPAELESQVISYGPCQFPTLGFVVDRYDKVENFVPEAFWYISLEHRLPANQGDQGEGRTGTGMSTAFTWERGHLFDYAIVQMLHRRCLAAAEAVVTNVQKKPTKKWKPYPLTTVELQKAGSRLLHLAPKKVLDIAEALYNKGFLSYPRTETDTYDKDFDFHSLIEKQQSNESWGHYAQTLNGDRGHFDRPRDGKKNDQAHPPIHPIAHAPSLVGDDKRVYDYVTRRFLASCSRDAVGWQTTVTVEMASEGFQATGLVVTERNFLDVYPYEKWESNVLPDIYQAGFSFIPTPPAGECALKEGQTTRPKLLTEADLVGLMDKNGIGTDATIAEHITKVIDRQYVMMQTEGRIKYLVPSTLGIGLVEGYNKVDLEKSLSKPFLRRETEHRMDLIARNERTKQEIIDETLDEYRAVFVTVNSRFQTLIDSVGKYFGVEGGEESGQDENAFLEFGSDGDGGDGGGADGGHGGGRRGRARGSRQPGTRPSRRPHGRRDANVTSREDGVDDGDDKDGGFGAGQPPHKRARGEHRAGPAPTCACGEETIRRQVKKDGPNKGRWFWACHRPRDEAQCDFFEWADGPSKRSSASASSAAANNARPARQAFASTSASTVQSDRSPPQCRCQEASVERTSGKEGANQGRKFWACAKPREEQCGFFEWLEGPSCASKCGGQYGRSVSCTGAGQTARSLQDEGGEEDARYCKCSEPAAFLTVAKDGPNQGRRFYGCAKPRDAGSCGFFEWADEPPRESGGRCAGPSSLGHAGRNGGAEGWASRSRADDADAEKRRCDCGLEAALKTVFKEGPNKGREFWCCCKESERLRCKFFEWADGQESRGGGGTGNRSSMSASPQRPAGKDYSGRSGSGSARGSRGGGRGIGGRGGRKGSGGGTVGGGAGSCFNCGKRGHWASECPV
ncbi:prokaryotic type I DNA topoisomerase [Tilletiaria anomala UBC 951]|uniref:DNA topoisomerase n=1 Tax=Tilletiaria anomala (strain ATCC 24038 / CBS 436.72 / UBC 951) TaxID=1037660 RepID=A0A066W1D5_TILAU|nr:prokaryotic type I DNA topoisomerase [Tilletiaria anomala UBC 951]KDN47556.1 prokaryotic type I DNA topoisomerase [Tilletiaria anomala UBC 951]